MTTDWLSYGLSDFVMVSSRVYQRQLELHNMNLMGLQAVALALGAYLVWLIIRRPEAGNRIIPILLGLVWLWVAWSFLWQRYSDINLVGHYAGIAFAIQGAALLATGLRPSGLSVRLPTGAMKTVAAALLIFSLVLYPLLTPLLGRAIIEAEFFAMMPDPTAVATLAILANSQSRIRWPFMVVPLLWCAFSGATLWVLGLPQFWAVAPAAPLFLVLAALPRR